MDLLTELAILVLAAFVGFEVISKVPNTLHTPLMSATNAIHGIVLLGAILVIGPADGLPQRAAAGDRDRVRHDQRGRRLPRHRPDARHVQGPQARSQARGGRRAVSRADCRHLLYIVGFALFIVGLHMVRGPRTAVRGNQVAAVGMAIALVGDADRPADRRLGPDRRRRRDRHGDRRPGRAQREDDRDAADGGAVQRRRRRRGRADLARRVPRGRRHPARGADPDRVRRDHRLDLVLGLERRVLQAAGADLGQAALPGPAAHAAQHRRSPRSCSRSR